MSLQANEEQVVTAVRDFWKTFCGSDPASLAEHYSPEAVLFGVEGTRSEPVRLALARRQREYFQGHAQLKFELGLIEVQLLTPTLALATYTFSFHAANVAVAGGKPRERQIAHGRATQIFELTADGRLLIVHEHLSSSDIRKE
jgi:ketosteroid isomerase-like protein